MLTELFSAPMLIEASSDPASPDLATIRGRFIAEGARSSNHREYVNVEPWIKRAQEKIDAGGIVDIRTCHEAGDKATEIVGKITRLHPDGQYEGTIANTPTGQAVLPLVKGGYLKHVSLRGYGARVEPIEGQEGWTRVIDLERLAGIDFTNNPGITQASVNLAESVDADQVIDSFEVGTTESKFSTDDRKAMAKSGVAMPDGSFPIPDATSLEAAIHLYGRSEHPDEVKQHIIKRARALGLTDRLPKNWSVSQGENKMGFADKIDETIAATTEATTEPTTEPTTESPTGEISIEQALETLAGLDEAGAALSAANRKHLTTAHDHIAKAAGMQCLSSGDEQPAGESQPETPDVQQLVEAAVSAALERERASLAETIEAQRKAAVEETIDQYLAAKRKTSVVTELDEKPSLGQAIDQYVKTTGIIH
ncbi:MAG: hypothetical protein ACRDFS_02395 [Chloroflexota bacterium]